jgi:hypothetical protein
LNIDSESRFAGSIKGQLLRQSTRREVAIFLHDGALWIADFVDGDGVLIDAATWFRFNCAAPSSSHARRRMVLESAIPLSQELVARIRRLHRPATMRKHGALVRLIEGAIANRARIRLAVSAICLGRRRKPHADGAD